MLLCCNRYESKEAKVAITSEVCLPQTDWRSWAWSSVVDIMVDCCDVMLYSWAWCIGTVWRLVGLASGYKISSERGVRFGIRLKKKNTKYNENKACMHNAHLTFVRSLARFAFLVSALNVYVHCAYCTYDIISHMRPKRKRGQWSVLRPLMTAGC